MNISFGNLAKGRARIFDRRLLAAHQLARGFERQPHQSPLSCWRAFKTFSGFSKSRRESLG